MGKGKVPRGWKRLIIHRCVRKIAWETLEQATESMRYLKERDNDTTETKAFQCPLCDYYHWGHEGSIYPDFPQEIIEKWRPFIHVYRKTWRDDNGFN